MGVIPLALQVRIKQKCEGLAVMTPHHHYKFGGPYCNQLDWILGVLACVMNNWTLHPLLSIDGTRLQHTGKFSSY